MHFAEMIVPTYSTYTLSGWTLENISTTVMNAKKKEELFHRK